MAYRLRFKWLALFISVLTLVLYSMGDQIAAQVKGEPVTLNFASGSLDAPFDTAFVHASLGSEGSLRLKMRIVFHSSAQIAKPFLTVDGKQNGILHLDVRSRFELVGTKCEFLRQIEVEFSKDQWSKLETLAIHNHSISNVPSDPIKIGNQHSLEELFAESRLNLAMEQIIANSSAC
jgi:hypothetical protein